MDTYGVSHNLENYEAQKLVTSVICSEPAQVCSKGLSLSMRNPAQSTAAHLYFQTSVSVCAAAFSQQDAWLHILITTV
jgi:hypothetical protein